MVNLIESPGRFLWHSSLLKISLVILSPPLLRRDVHIVTNNSFCDTCYIFSRGRKLMCIVSWDCHSLSIGTFCIVSDFFFPFWTVYLRVFLQFPKSMSFSSMVYNFQLWFYQLPHQVLMLWFTFWLHSSLFLLPICRRSVHCLMHIKQPDANFCCLFLMSMFLSSWLTLLIRQCSKMETFGFCVISNW